MIEGCDDDRVQKCIERAEVAAETGLVVNRTLHGDGEPVRMSVTVRIVAGSEYGAVPVVRPVFAVIAVGRSEGYDACEACMLHAGSY
jgi:hypothetical protein